MSGKNRLIEVLSPALRTQVLAIAKSVDLQQRETLFRTEEPLTHIHLLNSGIASIVVSVSDGGSAEISLQGNEGIIGIEALLGDFLPVSTCLMQTDGEAYRIPVRDFRRLFNESTELRQRVLQNLQTQSLTLNQIAGCNKLHRSTERLSRWLLTAADRLHADVIGLTQETLSQMLGTRRTTVALVAGTLQRSGLIRYSRGKVTILKREELVDAACDCYRINKRLVDQLYVDAAQ